MYNNEVNEWRTNTLILQIFMVKIWIEWDKQLIIRKMDVLNLYDFFDT